MHVSERMSYNQETEITNSTGNIPHVKTYLSVKNIFIRLL